MGDRSRHRREGRKAFHPEGNPDTYCPYESDRNPYPRECWIIGWNEEKETYEAEQARLEIGYVWEDPESDPIAAIRQLQELFDEQLRNE